MTSPLTTHIHAAPDAHAGFDRFGAPWDVAERALKHLSRLPKPLLHAWSDQPYGQIVVGRHDSHYEPGPVLWRDLRTRAVLFIASEDVTKRAPDFWEPVGAWLDHWLGSRAAEDGTWLSDGGTFSLPVLQDAAERLQRVLGRRYAEEFLETTDHRIIFARGFGWMMIDQKTLSAADPHMAKWYRSTMLSSNFWKQLRKHMRRD